MDSLDQDLARLRAIAEEGRRAPLLGGWHFILWGSAIAAGLLINWVVIERFLSWPDYALAISWFGLVSAAAAGSALLGRRQEQSPGAYAIGNKVERTVWTWTGAFLMTMSVALLLRAAFIGDPAAWSLFAIMSPIGLGAYAIAIGTTAIASDDHRATPFAFLSLAFAAATTLLIGEPEQFPLAAAGVAIVTFSCGVRQLRAARQAA